MQLSRRECLGLAVFSLASSCGPKKGTGYPGYALIATSGDKSLAVVDLLSFQLLPPIPLDAPPTAVVPGPNSARTYVLTPDSGSVHLINAALQHVASQKLAAQLSEIRLSPDGKFLLAIASEDKQLVIADAISLSVVHRVKLPSEPVSMDVSASGDIALSLGATGQVYLILGKGDHRQSQVSGAIGQVRFRADGKVLIASRPATRGLTIMTVPELAVMAELPLAMQPQNLCFTPDGGQLFVTGDGMDAVAIVFPYNTLEVEQTILAGRDPGVMACSNTPLYVFVASHSGSDISILDVDSRKLIALVEVGTQPSYIAITPDNQYALVLDKGSGDLAIIHIPAIHRNRGKSGAALFTMFPVGNEPILAAVVGRA